MRNILHINLNICDYFQFFKNTSKKYFFLLLNQERVTIYIIYINILMAERVILSKKVSIKSLVISLSISDR